MLKEKNIFQVGFPSTEISIGEDETNSFTMNTRLLMKTTNKDKDSRGNINNVNTVKTPRRRERKSDSSSKSSESNEIFSGSFLKLPMKIRWYNLVNIFKLRKLVYFQIGLGPRGTVSNLNLKKVRVFFFDIVTTSINRIASLFILTFLPNGYPYSVKEEYLEFQLWDALQGFCSYLRGMLTTKAILEAAGVGDADATALSAAITWIMRDGVALICSLVFSCMISSSFEANVKEWRLFADVINDVGLTLDMINSISTFKPYFVPLTCLSAACRTVCGVAAGCTKSSISLHFCLTVGTKEKSSTSSVSSAVSKKKKTKKAIKSENNNKMEISKEATNHLGQTSGYISDLVAKEGTQENLVTLLGIVTGMIVAPYTQNFYVAWVLFLFFTFLHVYANYKGVECLNLQTLNCQRLNILIEDYLKKKLDTNESISNDRDENQPSVLKPKEVGSKHEKVWVSFWSYICSLNPKIGASLSMVHITADVYQIIKEKIQLQQFFVVYTPRTTTLIDWYTPSPSSPSLFQIVLSESANASNILEAYFTVKYFQYLATRTLDQNDQKLHIEKIINDQGHLYDEPKLLFHEFIELVESCGWDISNPLLGDHGYRLELENECFKEKPE